MYVEIRLCFYICLMEVNALRIENESECQLQAASYVALRMANMNRAKSMYEIDFHTGTPIRQLL
jgi:hypothetical protein